jgi:hypothetical protein
MTGVLKSASLWARSSMVEQWPFKPLVKGSSPFALTMINLQKQVFFFACHEIDIDIADIRHTIEIVHV